MFTWLCQKKGPRFLIVANKSTNKIQVRQMEKQSKFFLTICIGFGNQQIAEFFHDQTICITDCENLTIGHSLYLPTQ